MFVTNCPLFTKKTFILLSANSYRTRSLGKKGYALSPYIIPTLRYKRRSLATYLGHRSHISQDADASDRAGQSLL